MWCPAAVMCQQTIAAVSGMIIKDCYLQIHHTAWKGKGDVYHLVFDVTQFIYGASSIFLSGSYRNGFTPASLPLDRKSLGLTAKSACNLQIILNHHLPGALLSHQCSVISAHALQDSLD